MPPFQGAGRVGYLSAPLPDGRQASQGSCVSWVGLGVVPGAGAPPGLPAGADWDAGAEAEGLAVAAWDGPGDGLVPISNAAAHAPIATRAVAARARPIAPVLLGREPGLRSGLVVGMFTVLLALGLLVSLPS